MEVIFDENEFYETNRYRCLFHTTKQIEDIYQVSCGIERCTPEKRKEFLHRENYHLHVVLNGKGYMRVNGGETIEIRNGQMFLLKPDEPVTYYPDKGEPWTYCWVTFDGPKAKDFMDLSGFTDEVNVLECNQSTEEYLRLVQKMLDHSELNFANDLLRVGLTLEYISLAIESYNKEKRANRKYREYSQESYVEFATHFINNNYASITVEDISKAIGIHRSHLASIFKKQMGISPQEYLLRCRMKESCRLLRESELPIQIIAARVGYDNALTFSKMFKKSIGMSPREYRNAH